MPRWLAGLLLLLLGTVAAAATPPVADRSAPPGDLARTLTLLEQVDPQTLPETQRQTLYFAVVDALISDGQQERALDFLVQARHSAAPSVLAGVDEQIGPRLQRLHSPVLTAALQAGTPLAALIQAELSRRSAAALEPAIGVILPLSGRYAPFGESVRKGLELARDAMPSAVPVRFLYRDSAGDGTTAARLVEEFSARPELLAVIGPLTSGEATSAAAQAESSQLPMLLLAPHEGVTGGQVFRYALTAAAQTEALADYADRLGLKRLAILHPDSRAGDLFAELFQGAVERYGGQVLARRSYPAAAVDLRKELQALAAAAHHGSGSGPEALFLPDSARQVAQIIPQLGFSRLDQLQLLGTSTWNDPNLVRLAGPQSEGAVFVDGFFADSPWPEVRDFVARYQEAYGMPPSILAAQGFDAGRLLLHLLGRSQARERKALRHALATQRDFPGVAGFTCFGPQGEAELTLFLLQVQDGSVVQIN
jgi:ABC-type branched-subunit amino acid transport system substrate-binding protein